MLNFEIEARKVLYLARSRQIKISSFFSQSEYNLLETDSFKGAISLIEEDFDIDIIIETVHPGIKDYLNFLKYVKGNNKFRYIPYIVFCEKPDNSVITKIISNKANEIIIEYDNGDLVLEKVKNALKNGKKRF